ncbi:MULTISPECIES: SIR2 family protein [Corallococcus]|uniref:SIR2 family protein n=1 Tax=Corallococcus TaxID=83461 RepID=UPI00131569E5|nr:MULTISPECIES: SIR2 family protein [Corallococcus]
MQASTPNKKIAFLVGSPLSTQAKEDAPQVPGVEAMLELIRKRVPAKHLEQFDAELKAGKNNRYQWAMKFLQDRSNRGIANTVIREAVLRARTNARNESGLTEAQLDDDFSGWALPPATLHLGKLLADHPERFGPVLTTNFDPLISASVKMAKGEFLRTVVDRDEPFSQAKLSTPNVAHIVHLHGYWLNGETLHTPMEIARERKRVTADIIRLLNTHTLIVVGYGGWDDVFTQTLSSIAADRHQNVDILWAFYDSETVVVEARNKHLFNQIRELTGRNQLRIYGGINCHELFAKIREDFDTPGAPSAIGEGDLDAKRATVPDQRAGGTGDSHPAQAPVNASTTRPRPPHSPRPESATTQPAPTGPVIAVSPASTVSPAINQASSPPQKDRSTANWLVPVLALPLFVGAFALVTQSNEHREVGTDMPPPRNAIPNPQKPVFTSFPAPAESISILRQQHRVSVALTAERASHVDQLPRGRYAFVQMESVPSFNAKTPLFGSLRDGIELHRTPNDELFFVGYVDPQSRATLRSKQATSVALVPSPSDKRPQAVSIPVARLTTAEVRQDNGTRVLLLDLNGSR